MKKLFRNTIFTVIGGVFAMSLMLVPLMGTAQAAAPEAAVSVKSYDMDEYLDMLLQTGQYAKYDRFARIASPESWAKHVTKYNTWVNGYPVYAVGYTDPAWVVRAEASRLGFDAANDLFTLQYQSDSNAMVQVLHGTRKYQVSLERTSNGGWYVTSVQSAK